VESIAVVGATGHTGRFVVDELERRSLRPVCVGRDARKLAELRAAHPTRVVRAASSEDPESLNAALAGCVAVINCAGPFLDTALPVADAALRAKIPYLDITAEQAAVQRLQTRDANARDAGIVLLPAAAFYGGLADVLATAALDGEVTIDEISIAVALDSWHPTEGTRRTGARNTAPRLIVRGGTLAPIPDPQPKASWVFPAPFHEQEVLMLPFSETITLSRHLRAASIESWINATALRDVRDAATPAPAPADSRGRSSQNFVMDVRVRAGERRARATAAGRDIYAASAPIIVEAAQRLLAPDARGAGVRSLGEVVDARDFLRALAVTGDLAWTLA